jgi:hypothetical protein
MFAFYLYFTVGKQLVHCQSTAADPTQIEGLSSQGYKFTDVYKLGKEVRAK